MKVNNIKQLDQCQDAVFQIIQSGQAIKKNAVSLDIAGIFLEMLDQGDLLYTLTFNCYFGTFDSVA